MTAPQLERQEKLMYSVESTSIPTPAMTRKRTLHWYVCKIKKMFTRILSLIKW